MSKYRIKINLEIEFFESKIKHSEMRELVQQILRDSKKFKRVHLINYSGNTMNDETPFSDIIPQISGAFLSSSLIN